MSWSIPFRRTTTGFGSEGGMSALAAEWPTDADALGRLADQFRAAYIRTDEQMFLGWSVEAGRRRQRALATHP